MIAAGSSLATLRSAPATTHRRRLLEDAADSDAFGFAARESFSREGDSAAAGRTIPPLPPIASPGLRRLSALRGGAYASEADGSGDFESGRSDSDSDSDSDSPYAVATLAGGGGGGSAMARSTRWWGDFGGGDADDLGNLGGSAADPTEEEDTAYAGENDPWYAAFRAAGMSRADLLSRLSCDRVFRFQPAEGVCDPPRSRRDFATRRRRAKRRAAGRTARTARWTRTMTMGATGATLRADP